MSVRLAQEWFSVKICCEAEADQPQLKKQRTEKFFILMKAITCYGTDR